MVRHLAAAWVILAFAVTCCGSSEVCHDGSFGCPPEGPEDASLLQLRPAVDAKTGDGKGVVEVRTHAHSPAHAAGDLKCPGDGTPALLGRLDGEDLQLSLPAYSPLDVPAGSSLTLLVCNLGNTGESSPPTSVLSSFVGSVGAAAHVYVLVANSFNVRASGHVLLGPALTAEDAAYLATETNALQQQLDARRAVWGQLDGQCPSSVSRRRRRALLQSEEQETMREQELEEEREQAKGKGRRKGQEQGQEKEKRKMKRQEAARQQRSRRSEMQFLVPPAVAGPVGKGAVVQVTVKDSGNVETSQGSVLLQNVTLVGPAVSTSQAQGLDNVTVQVGAFNSGNVISRGAGEGQLGNLTIVRASLLGAGILADGFKGTQGRVHWEGSGKVQAKALTLLGEGSTLSAAAFSSSAFVDPLLQDSRLGLTLVQAANFEGEGLAFVRRSQEAQPVAMGSLLQFPGAAVTGCTFDISLSSAGNFGLSGDILGSGHLLGEVLLAETLQSSRLELTMLNSANLKARSWYLADTGVSRQPLWIDDLVDLNGASDLESLKVHLGNSANLRVGQLELEQGGDRRGAVRRVIYVGDDIEPLNKATFQVTIDESANWQGELLFVQEAQFNLIEHVIDINADDVVSSHVSLSMSRTGNANGTTVCLQDELLDEPMESRNFNRSTIVAVLTDAASVRASNRFELAEEDLIDEVVEVDDLFDTQVRIVLEGVSNVEAEVAVLRDSAELVEVVLDTDDLLAGTAVDLVVTNCGNVKAEHLTMSGSSYLLQDVMQGNFVTEVPVSIAISSSGNAQAVAEISDESRLLLHVIDPSSVSQPSNFGGTSITLTESASLQTTESTLRESSYLLGVVVDEVSGSTPFDLSQLKSFSMFATAVGNDKVVFTGSSGPCEQSDLPKFAVPFAHSCVPLP